MTSLMVIFVLLFLAFVHNQVGKRETVKESILKELKKKLIPIGFREDYIKPDENDRNAVVIIVPERLMNFDSGDYHLKKQGQQFIEEKIPFLAQTLAAFHQDIDSIVVEGHTDRQHRQGDTQNQGEAYNLQLSQNRSMEVVKLSLNTLEQHQMTQERAFFLDKLSASGRGEQNASTDPEKVNNEEDRRVIFRIRIRPSVEPAFTQEVKVAAAASP
jgi:outer membrane protein OmpA-like peptidoglycan-associated protein